MSIWNYLSQNGDPKRTLGSLPQKGVNWNYTVPSDNTKTPSANTTGVYYPNMKKETVITPQTRQNYYRTGGKEYDPNYTNPYEPYNLSQEGWKNVATMGAGFLPGIGEGIDTYDFITAVGQGDPIAIGGGLLGMALPFIPARGITVALRKTFGPNQLITPHGIWGEFRDPAILNKAHFNELSDNFNRMTPLERLDFTRVARDRNQAATLERAAPSGHWNISSIVDAIRTANGYTYYDQIPLSSVPRSLTNYDEIIQNIRDLNTRNEFLMNHFRSQGADDDIFGYGVPSVSPSVRATMRPREWNEMYDRYSPNLQRAKENYIDEIKAALGPNEHYTPETIQRLRDGFMYDQFRSMTGTQGIEGLPLIPRSLSPELRDFFSAREIELGERRMQSWNPPAFRFSNSIFQSRPPIDQAKFDAFGQMFADKYNNLLRQKGYTDYEVSPGYVNRSSIGLKTRNNSIPSGGFTIGLNDKASEKIANGDWSLPDFPNNATNPFFEIPVMTMQDTYLTGLPEGLGIYSQSFFDDIRDTFGIRVGAGRNSQTRTELKGGGRKGSHNIWRNKVMHGKAYNDARDTANDNFTRAISYGLLGPAFYRLLQLRDGDAQRTN